MSSHRPRPKLPSELSHEQLVRADLLIRQTYEKQQVLFLQLRALQVQVSQLRQELQTALTVLLTLVHDPEGLRKSEAVVKDFLIQKKKGH